MAGTRKYVAGFTRGSFLTASRGRNPDSTPPTPLRLGLSKPAPRETQTWSGPGRGLKPYHLLGLACLPILPLSTGNRGKGKKSSHYMRLEGKPNWNKDGFLG